MIWNLRKRGQQRIPQAWNMWRRGLFNLGEQIGNRREGPLGLRSFFRVSGGSHGIGAPPSNGTLPSSCLWIALHVGTMVPLHGPVLCNWEHGPTPWRQRGSGELLRVSFPFPETKGRRWRTKRDWTYQIRMSSLGLVIRSPLVYHWLVCLFSTLLGRSPSSEKGAS